MVENRDPKGNYLLVSTIMTYYIYIYIWFADFQGLTKMFWNK